MILSFTLSMPNVGSWNGKWSGESKPYAKIHNFGKSKKGEGKAREISSKGSYYYNFGDGWGASIRVKEVDSKEATKIKRQSDGFCGYDWMVNEILDLGRIRTLGERERGEGREEKKETQKEILASNEH